MILAVSEAEFLILSMASDIRFMDSTPSSAVELASLASELAWLALSAFWRVMDAISSSADDVSSRLDACSLAPWASDWLALETWLEAEDI